MTTILPTHGFLVRNGGSIVKHKHHGHFRGGATLLLNPGNGTTDPSVAQAGGSIRRDNTESSGTSLVVPAYQKVNKARKPKTFKLKI